MLTLITKCWKAFCSKLSSLANDKVATIKDQQTHKEMNNHERQSTEEIRADLLPLKFQLLELFYVYISITEMLKLIGDGLTNMNKSVTKRNWIEKWKNTYNS